MLNSDEKHSKEMPSTFNKMLFYKIVVVGTCLLLVLLLGSWFRKLPKARIGSNLLEGTLQGSSLHFFALGDTGMANDAQMQVAEAMEKRCQNFGGIDGLLLLGDTFYYTGVTSKEDSQWKSKVEEPYGGECLKKAPIYPVLGNHDYKGNVDAQILYSGMNKRWHLPYRFYRLDFGALLRIVAFDSPFPDFCLIDNLCAVDFLRHSLDTPTQKWKIVLAHHPLNSSSVKGHSHSGGLFGFLMKPLVCDKTDVWLAGHAHHLEHRRDSDCSADIFVSGGGGATLYDVKPKTPEVNFAASSHGFLELSVVEESINFAFISSLGETLYSTERKR